MRSASGCVWVRVVTSTPKQTLRISLFSHGHRGRQSPDSFCPVLAYVLPLTVWRTTGLFVCYYRNNRSSVMNDYRVSITHGSRCLIGGMASLLSWDSPPTRGVHLFQGRQIRQPHYNINFNICQSTLCVVYTFSTINIVVKLTNKKVPKNPQIVK